jgi:hypothetical protein
MLIQDLRFIEATDATADVRGGASAFTSVTVNADGSKGAVEAYGFAYGDNTSAQTLVGTRSAAGTNFKLSAATGAATSFGVTLDGKNSRVATSVSTGVATDVTIF